VDPLASSRETGSRLVGRYLVHRRIAAGGMATVHLGRLLGAAGFSRTVAIKRLHEAYARDPEFVAMLLDEARLASQIRHPNVVPTLDVVAEQDELLVVMEYVAGDSLAHLGKLVHLRGEKFPIHFAAAMVAQALHGLHAAHEATDAHGDPLGIVHRDVSPQNVLVGTDGVARVLDFGIAKAASRATATEDGQIKGKTAYMAPEQLSHGAVDRRTDVWAAGVMFWELLTGRRLFLSDTPAATIARVLHDPIDPPTRYRPECPLELAMVCVRALERDQEARFASAEEMALAIEDAIQAPRPKEIGLWVQEIAASTLESRAELVREVEREEVRVSHSTTDPELRAALEEAERRRQMADLPTDMGRPATPSRPVGVVSIPTPRGSGPIIGMTSPTPIAGMLPADHPSARNTLADTPVALSSRPIAAFPSGEVTGVATANNIVSMPEPKVSPVSIVLGAVGGLLLAAVVAIGFLFARGRLTLAKPPEALPSASVAIEAPPTPPPPAEPSAIELPVTPTPSVTVSATPKKPPVRPPAPHAAPPPKAPDCRVPVTVDANGNRHIRPECVN
jgi:serine/threonine-protein kinase